MSIGVEKLNDDGAVGAPPIDVGVGAGRASPYASRRLPSAGGGGGGAGVGSGGIGGSCCACSDGSATLMVTWL